jgi:uncharacterized protein with PIN domain
MKFVADKMLGRLARWLRLLGYDVAYGPHLSGQGLIRAARREGRIVLTRDRKIARLSHPPPLLLLESERFRDQLRQVVETFALGLDALFTRCSLCNLPLEPLPKESVRDRVPPYVFETQEKFSLCRSCGRIYWPATHHERIREELRSIGIRIPGI